MNETYCSNKVASVKAWTSGSRVNESLTFGDIKSPNVSISVACQVHLTTGKVRPVVIQSQPLSVLLIHLLTEVGLMHLGPLSRPLLSYRCSSSRSSFTPALHQAAAIFASVQYGNNRPLMKKEEERWTGKKETKELNK